MMKKKTICRVLCLAGALSGNMVNAADEQPEMLAILDSSAVSVSGEIGRRVSMTVSENVFAIDYENVFLEPFRHQKAEPEARDGFVGIGMHIDGLVTFAEYDDDPELHKLKEWLINELIKTQDDSGYIGIFVPSRRKQEWDTHESSYIVLALTRDFVAFGNEPSLRAARKLADNLIRAKDGYTCGFEQALLQLYKATGDSKYLDYCVDFLGLPEFKGGSEHHSTHVYGYVARAYAQLQLYELVGDPKLLQRSMATIENMITFHAMDITGTMGSWEHWANTQAGQGACGETCASAYSIRMLSSLLRIEGDAFYGDIMERIIYNALFAAQSPDGRQLRYFTPFEDVREYYPDDYFCCPSNFRRIVAELPQFIYFEDSEGIYVNLYNASKMKTKVGGHEVTLEQVTDYPTSEEVMIKLSSESDQPFLLRLRIPSWCRDARVTINGQIVEQRAMPGRFLEIRRQWSEDDEVRIKFPMAPRFVSGKVTQYGRAAMMRGPIVYCLNNRLNDGLLDPAARKQSIVIDPSSVSQLERDDMLRPNGTRFSAKAISIDGEPLSDRLLWFTEFIDPEGIKTYINLPKDQFDQYTRDDEFLLKDTF